MDKLSLKDLSLKGKRVLLRVDFNVPLNKDGTISDDSRIRASLPSIQYILDQGASLVIMSHLGRPKAKPDPAFTLAPSAKRLSELLEKPVPLAPDCVGPEVEKMASNLKAGEVLLLENVRFHPGEETPEEDPSFTKQLAKLGDVYVNDAFGTAHRAHASTAMIAKLFPGNAAAGFLMEKEVKALGSLIHNPARPFYAVIGGAKVSTKIGLIQNLLKTVDALFLGGAMAFTFFKAQGIEIGDSLFEAESMQTAKDVLAAAKNNQLHLPVDLVIADGFSNDAKTRVVAAKDGIPVGWQGLDIGPETANLWAKEFLKAKTVFWNGPVGAFEMAHFAAGTNSVAKALAGSGAQVTVGGGDSISAIEKIGLSNRFYHLSTGGGASLEYLEYGHLPGIDALSNR